MVVQKRGTAGTVAVTNTESGSGGCHTAGTGTESTQGYKPTSSLIKHLISTMLIVVLFSSTVENAYAYVKMLIFMLVSITSFLWIKACCKMARYSTIYRHNKVLAYQHYRIGDCWICVPQAGATAGGERGIEVSASRAGRWGFILELVRKGEGRKGRGCSAES